MYFGSPDVVNRLTQLRRFHGLGQDDFVSKGSDALKNNMMFFTLITVMAFGMGVYAQKKYHVLGR